MRVVGKPNLDVVVGKAEHPSLFVLAFQQDFPHLSLMAEEDAGYELRFRSVELWEMLRQWLGK